MVSIELYQYIDSLDFTIRQKSRILNLTQYGLDRCKYNLDEGYNLVNHYSSHYTTLINVLQYVNSHGIN